jgi:hypothetical protein
MAATSDKARFYLEQSIPELQEYERKKIFSKVLHLSTIPLIASKNTNRPPRMR